MRRRLAYLFLGLMLLQLTGCARAVAEQEQQFETILFYYGTGDYTAENAEDQAETYGMDTGAMDTEKREFDRRDLEVETVLHAYLEGPRHSDLVLPLPKEQLELHWELEDQVLTLEFGPAAAELPGIQKTLAASCLVHTMTQLPMVSSVFLPELSGALLKPSDFLLLDNTATSDEMILRLYYADQTGRYLRPETHSHLFEEDESMPAYAARMLLSEPADENSQVAVPYGTRPFWCRVEDGTCIVNLSEEFVNNAPRTHTRARTAVFSLVNTLTELPDIECVQFICAGVAMGDYMGLDLSGPLYREETAILTPREEQWYYDATLYVPCAASSKLAPVPVMVHNTEPDRLALDVLHALINFKPINGYENPIPEGTVATEVTVQDGLCTVSFNGTFAMCDSDPERARNAVRSVVSTLCTLEGVNRVRIELVDEALRSVDLSSPLRFKDDWVLP